MVVYDPPAGELVVYKHPSSDLSGAASTAAAHAIAASSLNAMPSSLAPLFQRGGGGGGSGRNADLQPYVHSASGAVAEIPSCRLCHRPFWPSFPHDVDEDFGTGDSAAMGGGAGAGAGGGMGRRQFTSSDYFHLLHATEQAADASREHSARASDAEDTESKQEAQQQRRGRARNRRGRSEQRGSVEIVEELPDTAPPAARTRRAAAAARSGSHSSGERDIPIVRSQQGRSSRAGTGVRARRSAATAGDSGGLSVSSSTEDFTTVGSAASPAHIVEEVSDNDEEDGGGRDDGGEAEVLYDDGGSSSAAAPPLRRDSDLDDSDLLACGLHRSSFNSGYYSKFFREECKLGSGGVGGVYLTHHVLDDVMLGTYAVKKIPVGNCVTDDHQLMTEHGFLYFGEVMARVSHGRSLHVACFDAQSSTLVYLPITAADVVSQDGVTELVDLTSTPGDGEVSLRVTPAHEMYIRHGRMSSTCIDEQKRNAAPFVKSPASDVLDLAENDTGGSLRIQLLSCAEGGFAPIDAQPLPFAQSLGLGTPDQEHAFLELYGYWLGGGSMDAADGTITFSPVKSGDAQYLDALFARLPLPLQSVDASSVHDAYCRSAKDTQGRIHYRIQSSRWRAYFDEQNGEREAKGIDGGKRFWLWVLKRLGKSHLRLILRGLQSSQREVTDDERGSIYTSSVRFRDELVCMLLHAGYAAHFRRNTPVGTQTGHSTPGVASVARHDGWLVFYSDHGSATQPTLHAHRDITRVAAKPVHTWCVTVPHKDHLIVMRRVLEADEHGVATVATKPVVLGNSRAWLLQVLKEVRALEGLHHRHIVAYKHSWLEAFKPSDFGPAVPCLFLLMEYANRGTLANLIWPKVPVGSTGAAAARARAAAVGGGVPQPTYMQEEDVWWVFIGTCLGLRHLHRAGVIHRDLKPENLLMTVEIDALGREHGVRVLVSDFGNAILKGVPYNRTGNTGTLAYSAPETLMPPDYARRFMGQQQQQTQAAGGSSAAAAAAAIEYDERADLWSIGVILFAMAFGRLPFLSNSPEALFAEIRQKGGGELLFPSTPARSPELKQIIRDLLALDPNERPGLDEILSRPAIARRRAQRYAEFQAYRTQSAAAASHLRPSFADRTGGLQRETFRPPVVVSDFDGSGSSGGGNGAAAAGGAAGSLVISPNLLATPHQQRARSKSPAPLSLNAPKDSPTGSPTTETRSLRSHSEIGELPRASPPTASLSSSVAAAREPSTALVVSSSASHRGVVVEDALRLSPPLSLLLTVFNSLVSVASWFWTLGRSRADVAEELESKCWRCRWSPAKEGGVHLCVFGLKLWLGLSLLIDRPSSSSMYLHVFPEVLLSLLLFFTTPLTLTSYWLQQLQFPSMQHDGSTMLPKVARAMHGWSTSSPLRWQLLRMGLSLTACLLTAWWLHDASNSAGWQTLNALIALLQCVSLLCTYFAAHASHQLLHPPQLRRRGVAHTPLRTKLARSLSPLSLAAIPRASGAGSNGPSAPPSGSSTPAQVVRTIHHQHTGSVPVARVPLLLPPTPAPSERGGESPMSHASDAGGRVVLAPRPQFR